MSSDEQSLEHGMNESHRLTVTEVDTFQGEVHDSWIFFFHEVVLCEALVVNDNIRWKFFTIESTQLAP